MLRRVFRFLVLAPLVLLAPVALLVCAVALLMTSMLWRLVGRTRLPVETAPDTTSASLVIPNWNGRDLLEKYLPSVVAAMAGNSQNEVIVVDNASTDGSVEFLRERFPTVRVLPQARNLGFGGGSNLGIREAKNDIVVLLNSDMRVAPDFLQPLLDGFRDSQVFAVSCQIFFSDPGRLREETGLTQAWWSGGAIRVRHRNDDQISSVFPCFYPGGGSSAFDRRKFLELGGFDELLRPFYLEDTDLGFRAWKRGWKVLYQPASHVWHEHRGTIGKKFSRAFIDDVIRKNFLLFTWKNIHEPARLVSHFAWSIAGIIRSWIAGENLMRPSATSVWRAVMQLPGACHARWNALAQSAVSDSEALRRPLGGYYRDRFDKITLDQERLQVLFVSPYPISPPIHGGGVFMNQIVRELGKHADVHLVVMLDSPNEVDAHNELKDCTASMDFLVRQEGQPKDLGALSPFSVREFADEALEWIIHREMYRRKIDVVQLEYTNMGQYAGPTRQIPWILFEHDVYFQSIARGLGSTSLLELPSSSFEYLRALNYELHLLPKMDRVQTCSAENKQYLLSFLPELKDRIDDNLRAGIDTARYEFKPNGRQPGTLLFLGSFRHTPNLVALRWLLEQVMPLVLREYPEVRLKLVGSDPPPVYSVPDLGGAVELVGFVDDVRQPLADYAIFVCPILSGSGVRVKLLEAFAAGIPVVSTHIGAEGLGEVDGENCALADDPAGFAQRIVTLLRDPSAAEALASRARDYVVRERDMATMARKLELTYRQALAEKLPSSASDMTS